MTTTRIKSICLRGPEVLALLKDGRATVERKVKPQPAPSPRYAYCTAFYPDESYSRELGAIFSGHPVIPGRWWFADASGAREEFLCPFGWLGERRQVLETWTQVPREETLSQRGYALWPGTKGRSFVRSKLNDACDIIFRADGEFVSSSGEKECWRSATQMPAWASRLTVETLAVSVERDERGVWKWRADLGRVEP